MTTVNYHHIESNQRVWISWTTTSSNTTDHIYNKTIWKSWQTTSSNNITGTYHTPHDDMIWSKWNRGYYDSGTALDFYYEDNPVWEYWISYETIEDAFKIKTMSTEKKRALKVQRIIQHEWNKVLAFEREEEIREAEITAQELLLELIGDEQLVRYKETGRLFVEGNEFDYVLKKEGGVYRLEKNKVIDFAKAKKAKGNYICVHPKDKFNYPDTDNVISLKMWIENSEKEFLKIGNVHRSESVIERFDKIIGL